MWWEWVSTLHHGSDYKSHPVRWLAPKMTGCFVTGRKFEMTIKERINMTERRSELERVVLAIVGLWVVLMGGVLLACLAEVVR